MDVVTTEPATATPTNTAQATEPGPAVPIPPKTVPNGDKVLENIKARIAAANKPPEPASKVEDKPKEPEIKPDLASLMAELVKLQNQSREYKDQLKEVEQHKTAAQAHKELTELWAKDPRQAIAKMAGKDAEEAIADIVTMFYQDMSGDQSASTSEKPSKAEAAMMAKLEEVTKKLEALEGSRKAEADKLVQGDVQAQEAATKAFLKHVLLQNKDKFEISSRDVNIDEAIGRALSKTEEVAKAMVKEAAAKGKELDLAKLSETEALELATRALANAENAFSELGSRFAKQQTPTKPSVYDRPLTKPSMQFEKAPAKETFEQYKERVRKQYEQATGA